MPYIKSKLIIEEFTPVTHDIDGQSIGQLVDQAIGEMLNEMPKGAVPLSIEFGFEDANDFQRFAHQSGEALAHSSMEARRSGKTKRSTPVSC